MPNHDKDRNPAQSPAPDDRFATETPTRSAEMIDFRSPDPSLNALRARYDILAEVGRGGMGIVYRVRDRETGGIVALKVLRPEIAGQTELIARFKSELLLARKVTHKNVCRTYELLRFGDTVAISMEYVEGESLRSLLRRVEALTVRRGLKILRQVLAGLAEAHGQGVVHRDLKPENIVVSDDGGVKVMDFGIARSMEAAPTETAGILGTPAYMSPEQAEGKPADARTDLYALGLIMYEMFTGQAAFRADTPVALVHKQIHDRAVPPRSVDPYLPAFLEQAIEKCLEKDPKKRFPSVAELDAALEEQAAPELPEGEPVPAPHLSVWGKRDWALLVLGVVGLLYFLKFRNTVFPAATKPLEVDAISGRRAAEDLAIRLGRPFPELARADLEYRVERYWSSLLQGQTETQPRRLDPQKLLQGHRQTGLPIYWKFTFSSRGETPLTEPGGIPERYALMDRNGRVEEISNPYPPGWRFPNYHPASLEQRRAISKATAALACGSLPSDPVLVESSGGEQGAAYTALFRPSRPVGSLPVARVSLLAEKVVAVDCNPRPAGLTRGQVGKELFGIFQSIAWIGTLFLFITFMVYFGIGQCYRSSTLWRRLPVAVLLGLAGVWLLAPNFISPAAGATTALAPSLWLAAGGGLVATVVVLVGLVTSEHYLVRRMPAWVASYVFVWRGRLKEPSLGLAVVRGALLGLALAGAETAALHLTLVAMKSGSTFARTSAVLISGFADPAAVAHAAASFSPALFVVSAAVFSGVMIGLVFIGGYWATLGHKEFVKYRDRKFWRTNYALAMGIFAAFATIAFGLPVAQVLGVGLGFFVAPMLLLSLLGMALLHYDILTLIVAVSTAVLWSLNYPLLQVFEKLGNAGEWAVFIGWGLLVAAAAAVAFRSEITRGLQRAKAEME